MIEKRSKEELPSFLCGGTAQSKRKVMANGAGNLPPILNDSTIAEIKENFTDDPSFIGDAYSILNNVDSQDHHHQSS